MQKIVSTLILLMCIAHYSIAQEDEYYVSDYPTILFEDFIYKPTIKSALLHQEGLLISQPIVSLSGMDVLRLSFDELADEIGDYYYTIIHCNADWTPTQNLTEMEYIDGFSNERIRDYEFSYNTLTNYIHYELRLPNEDFSWTKSGNYLLVIYEDEDMDNLVLTKRFMVVDSKMQINASIEQPLGFSQARQAQEIDFIVNHKGIRVNNPQIEIKIAILQNGRWDNAITGLMPLFVRNEELLYDYQNKIVFKGNKEYRHLNLQTTRYKTDKMRRIIEDNVDGNIVQLVEEYPRMSVPYLFENDLNGKYIINNEHEDEPETEADYVWTLFYLNKPVEIFGGDVYIFGGLTEFQINPLFKMTYDEVNKQYQARVLLKQGFYNYQYAFVSHNEPTTVNLSEIEGDWYETENDYYILVYFRPYGSRYDQLVGLRQINTRE